MIGRSVDTCGIDRGTARAGMAIVLSAAGVMVAIAVAYLVVLAVACRFHDPSSRSTCRAGDLRVVVARSRPRRGRLHRTLPRDAPRPGLSDRAVRRRRRRRQLHRRHRRARPVVRRHACWSGRSHRRREGPRLAVGDRPAPREATRTSTPSWSSMPTRSPSGT